VKYKRVLYYSFNDGSWAREFEDTQMETGIGYIVRGEEHGLTRVVQVMRSSFGSPNNGVKQ
jgi:hypothetical protein